MAELTFGPLLLPEGDIGPVAINPPIPHAQDGFDIQWADANIDNTNWVGAYKDSVWITDDNRTDSQGNHIVVWSQVVDLPGLGPGQSQGRAVSVISGAIPPGRYTMHVWINSQYVPELYYGNNYSFNANIDVR